jgi:hypothetical protein
MLVPLFTLPGVRTSSPQRASSSIISPIYQPTAIWISMVERRRKKTFTLSSRRRACGVLANMERGTDEEISCRRQIRADRARLALY